MAVNGLWATITGWAPPSHPAHSSASNAPGSKSWLHSFRLGPSLAIGAGGLLAISAARRAKRRPSCCPPGALGPLGATRTACAALRGEVEQLPGGLDAYVVGKGNSRAVVVASDIFGIHLGRHKEICDSLAEEGFLVILPDFFHGAPQPGASIMENLQQAFSLWTPLNTPWRSVQEDLTQAVVPYLQQQGCPVERCAVLGFCWGAWMAVHSCGVFDFCCAAMAHPSVHNLVMRWGEDQETLLSKVRVPQLVLSSKDEPADWKPGGKAEETLKKNSSGHVFKDFGAMSHGFVVRGDLEDALSAAEVARAMEYIKGFLCKHTPRG